MAKQKRDLSIETLRGIAILLVVFLHAITDEASAGYKHFIVTFDYVFIPLFTTISGYAYAFRPVTPGKRVPFLSNKASRLLLPFFSVATLQYLLQSLMGGENAQQAVLDMWRIYIFGYAQFWFLQCLALVFLCVVLLEALDAISSLRSLTLSILISSACYVFVPLTDWVLVDGTLYLLPYFLLGCGLNRFTKTMQSRAIIAPAFVVTVTGLTVQQLALLDIIELEVVSTGHPPIAVIVGLTICVLFFRYRKDLPGLRQIGEHAYPIYLFHGFGIALGERLASLIPYGEIYTIPFTIKVVAGIVASFIAEAVLMRFTLLRKIFLGQR